MLAGLFSDNGGFDRRGHAATCYDFGAMRPVLRCDDVALRFVRLEPDVRPDKVSTRYDLSVLGRASGCVFAIGSVRGLIVTELSRSLGMAVERNIVCRC